MSVPAAYFGIVLIWSTTPLAIQWSSDGVGFLFAVTARMTIAVVVCFLLIKLLRVSFPWDKDARWTYMVSGLGLYAAMLSVYWAAQYIPSGLVSVVYGLLPLVTSVIAALWFKESSFQLTQLLGIGLGIFGLIIVFDPRVELELATLLGVSGVLLSTVLHSFSMLGIKRKGNHVPALSVTTGGLMVAVPLYLLTYVLFADDWPTGFTLQNISAILYLSIIGSVLGFVLFYYVLKKLSADVIALITLITPVCALLLGYFFNNEALSLQILSGTLLILFGLAIHNWGAAFFKRLFRVPFN